MWVRLPENLTIVSISGPLTAAAERSDRRPTTMKVVSVGAYDQRRCRAKNGRHSFGDKPFVSRVLRYGSRANKRAIKRLLKAAAKEVYDHHFEDHLKCPSGTHHASSAKMSYPSFDVYFGKNSGQERNDATVDRFAYGTGTGANTIGLDPQTVRYNKWLPVFDRLLEKLPNVSEDVRAQFNVVSVKVYYGITRGGRAAGLKRTARHADVNYHRMDRPAEENSQQPGSPVIILTFGGKKNLFFSLGRSSKNIQETTEFPILQSDSHGFYMEGADENPNEEGERWFHRSQMHPKNRGGVVISFMFREVRNTCRVNVSDGTLSDPGDDDDVFASVRNTYQHTDEYKASMEVLDGKWKRLLQRKIH